MIGLLACVLLLQEKPAIDKSAEPALKEVFRRATAVRNIRVVIDTFRKSRSGDWYTPSDTADLLIASPSKFRFEAADLIVISDGVSVMEDSLDDDVPIQIDRYDRWIKSGSVNQTLLSYFLDGEAGYDRLVDNEKPIVFAAATEPEKAIEFRAKRLGKIIVYFVDDPAAPLPRMFQRFRVLPGSESPDAVEPSQRQYMRIVGSGPLSPSLFVIAAPKGKKVEDKRSIVGGNR
jgi:outer membrane lipoprotein-sorting protein